MTSPAIRARAWPRAGAARLPWRPRTSEAVGIEQEFAEQYERHHQAIYRYCHSILRHDQDAQDALQATMLKALAAMQAGTVTGDLRPWLFRVAHNESISLRRRHDETPLEAIGEVATEHLEQRLADRAALARLQADLDDLADRQRTALVLREFSGLGHEEIAQVLGSTTGAVKQTIFEARKALQECETGRSMTCEQIQRHLSDQDGRTLRSRKLRAHLRDCAACTAFAEAMRDRPRQLALLAPAIPAVLGAGVFSNVVGGTQAATAGSAAAACGAGAATGATGVGAGTSAAASTIAASTSLKVAALVVAGGIAAGGGVAVTEHHGATTPSPAQAARLVPVRAERAAAAVQPASPLALPATRAPGAAPATSSPAPTASRAPAAPSAAPTTAAAPTTQGPSAQQATAHASNSSLAESMAAMPASPAATPAPPEPGAGGAPASTVAPVPSTIDSATTVQPPATATSPSPTTAPSSPANPAGAKGHPGKGSGSGASGKAPGSAASANGAANAAPGSAAASAAPASTPSPKTAGNSGKAVPGAGKP